MEDRSVTGYSKPEEEKKEINKNLTKSIKMRQKRGGRKIRKQY